MKQTPAQIKKQTEAKKLVLAKAKAVVQLSAVRLAAAKEEDALKAEIYKLMAEQDFDVVEETVTMDGRKVTVEVARAETATSSVDVGKLTGLLTDAQFKQCATVTLKAASEVLPKALVDKCIIPGEPRISYKVKASKGFPVPAVNLFK